jgi:cytochrome b561
VDTNTENPTIAARAIRYDLTTIVLHWTTAILVLVQFGSAQVWERLERGTPWRMALIWTHVACGILLAAVIVVRICWRFAQRGKIAPAVSGLQHLIASGFHLLLYGLLILQVILGFAFAWSAKVSLSFFGVFTIPAIVAIDPELRRMIAALHNGVAWTLIAVAGIHATAALIHHFLLRDVVLMRMLPGRIPPLD